MTHLFSARKAGPALSFDRGAAPPLAWQRGSCTFRRGNQAQRTTVSMMLGVALTVVPR